MYPDEAVDMQEHEHDKRISANTYKNSLRSSRGMCNVFHFTDEKRLMNVLFVVFIFH
jgi:hypothetical protein